MFLLQYKHSLLLTVNAGTSVLFVAICRSCRAKLESESILHSQHGKSQACATTAEVCKDFEALGLVIYFTTYFHSFSIPMRQYNISKPSQLSWLTPTDLKANTFCNILLSIFFVVITGRRKPKQ